MVTLAIACGKAPICLCTVQCTLELIYVSRRWGLVYNNSDLASLKTIFPKMRSSSETLSRVPHQGGQQHSLMRRVKPRRWHTYESTLGRIPMAVLQKTNGVVWYKVLNNSESCFNNGYTITAEVSHFRFLTSFPKLTNDPFVYRTNAGTKGPRQPFIHEQWQQCWLIWGTCV